MNFQKVKQKISRWYNGRVYGTEPGEDFPYIGFVYSKSAIRARKVVSYVKKEHKFLIGTLVAIISLFIAFLAL